MCLILFGLNHHSTYKLVLAANRDEFFARPTIAADFWHNKSVLSGRDVQSGGTWLGLTTEGRFIAITNYRDKNRDIPKQHSRGEISKSFLTGDQKAVPFMKTLSWKKDAFSGFNILISDDAFDTMYHYSNISDKVTQVEAGVHGLSNHYLDTPWPKVTGSKSALEQIMRSGEIKPNKLISMLANPTPARDQELPNTGISFDLEKKLSPVFISMKDYGTRCSTVILVDHNNHLTFLEVSYNTEKAIIGQKSFDTKLKP